MNTLISIDPGMQTGISVGTYSDTEPYTLTHSFQIGGGVEGFIKKVRVSKGEDWTMRAYAYLHVGGRTDFSLGSEEPFECEDKRYPECPDDDHLCYRDEWVSNTEVIAEKFTSRGGGQGFALRTEHLEPLRIEGAMLALGLQPHWVSPPQQYFAGGKTKPEKKKAQHRWLKEHDLYVTGKMVDSPDADDVRSSIAHAIAYLVRQKHMPTIQHYFKEG